MSLDLLHSHLDHLRRYRRIRYWRASALGFALPATACRLVSRLARQNALRGSIRLGLIAPGDCLAKHRLAYLGE